MYVHVDTPEFELLSLDAEIVLELTFFGQEVSLVSIVESHSISSQGLQELVFDPVDMSASGQRYLALPSVCDSTLSTLPPLRRNSLLG